MPRIPVLAALLATLAAPAPAQEVQLAFSCDLNGAPAQMLMAVHYQQAFDWSQNYKGDISGVFPVGVNVYTAGQIQSATGAYTFTGENDFADFTDLVSGARFRVQWVLDPPRNGVWMKVNPFGGTTLHFCAFQGKR